MKNVTFDTLKAIQNLRDAGFSESQASAIVSMMGGAFGTTVTTKADLAALESRVYPFGQEIRPSLRSRGTTRIRVDTAVLHELLRLNKATCDRRPIQE